MPFVLGRKSFSIQIEQIPDQGNAQRTKPLRLKRELHLIKTLGTQFHNADRPIKLLDLHTTQTQTSEVRWAARFSGHRVVTRMFA